MPAVYLRATEVTPPPPMSLADLPADAGSPTTTTSLGAPATVVATTAPDTSATATTATTAGSAPRGATGEASAVPPAMLASPVAGPWVVGAGTEARYDINDNVTGQSSKVVGRTTKVTGSMQIVDQSVTAVRAVVDMP